MGVEVTDEGPAVAMDAVGVVKAGEKVAAKTLKEYAVVEVAGGLFIEQVGAEGTGEGEAVPKATVLDGGVKSSVESSKEITEDKDLLLVSDLSWIERQESHFQFSGWERERLLLSEVHFLCMKWRQDGHL